MLLSIHPANTSRIPGGRGTFGVPEEAEMDFGRSAWWGEGCPEAGPNGPVPRGPCIHPRLWAGTPGPGTIGPPCGPLGPRRLPSHGRAHQAERDLHRVSRDLAFMGTRSVVRCQLIRTHFSRFSIRPIPATLRTTDYEHHLPRRLFARRPRVSTHQSRNRSRREIVLPERHSPGDPLA